MSISIEAHDRICQDLHQQIRSLIVENEKLRAALEQPEQEDEMQKMLRSLGFDDQCPESIGITLRRWKDGYAAALKQPERKLTDEVIADLWHANAGYHHHFARAIERWLKGQA